MKKFLSIVALFFAISFAYAQLPANSFAEDFTLLPINTTTLTLDTENPVHLYDYLDAGKPTVLDFSAVWCGSCWNYHTSGALETAYDSYGPNGTDQLRVVYLEGDAGTIANLNGSGGSTQGNWITGTPYPIIPTAVSPNTDAVVSDYSIAYFPTVYMVCPNRIVNEIGQVSAAAILSAAQACPQFDNTLANNAGIIKISKPTDVNHCSVTPEITIQNLGSATLTTATLTLNLDGTETTYNWTGSLTQYALGTITLPELTNLTAGSHTYSITISTVNGVTDTEASLNTISKTFEFQNAGLSSTISENFSSSAFPATGWGLTNNYWTRYASNQAIYFNGYSLSNGEWDELTLPLVDLSGVDNPAIAFDVAYARYQTSNEKLEVMVSTCSSSNWVTLYNKSGATLATAPATTNQYVPTSSQWRRDEVDLSQFAGNDAVRIKFKATSNYGNVLWLDNIAVSTASSINENDVINSSIYPNPANDNLYINADENIQQVKIFNVQGQLVQEMTGNVHEISVSNLSAGLYILQITTENNTVVHKFSKE